MHLYIEKPGDVITKQFHPNGALYLYSVLNDGKPANGWSNKTWFKKEGLQLEENYNNGLLIEKINYDESGKIIEHKIWSNRLEQLIDKPPHPKLPKPNVVTGYAFLSAYLKHLPAVSEFIKAEYREDLLLQSFNASYHAKQNDAKWTMKGEQMSFTIYWNYEEVSHQWHCHCSTEALYWKARTFFVGKL